MFFYFAAYIMETLYSSDNKVVEFDKYAVARSVYLTYYMKYQKNV